MKLLMDLSTFSSDHTGGKDEVAYNLLRGFSSLGYAKNITVITRTGVDRIVKNIDENYQTITVKKRDRRIYIAFILDILYGRKINKIIRDESVDCVIFTNKNMPSYKYSVPTILIPHDIQCFRNLLEYKDKSPSNIFCCFNIIVNCLFCDYIIAISEFDKKEMEKYLPKFKHKIKRIYDPIRFKPERKVKKREYITALNIQWEHKNVITLVRAYSRIAELIHEKLVLVGKVRFSEELGKSIEKIITDNNLEERVCFTGFVSETELEEIIEKTRIYVNTSLFEGFGMTAVEMMGSNVPTIVNKGTAMPETTMGLCRYYHPPMNDENLANVILQEIENPTSEEKLKSISKIIRSNYDYINISREYMDFIESIIKKK